MSLPSTPSSWWTRAVQAGVVVALLQRHGRQFAVVLDPDALVVGMRLGELGDVDLARISEAIQPCIDEGVFRADVDFPLTTRQITGVCTRAYEWLPDMPQYRARGVALVF